MLKILKTVFHYIAVIFDTIYKIRMKFYYPIYFHFKDFKD